jgi:MoxR-like ATPase
LAFLRGRSYVLVQDVRDMVLDVMRHRLVLSYEALSDNVTSDMILARVMDQIPVPAQPLHEHADVSVNA